MYDADVVALLLNYLLDHKTASFLSRFIKWKLKSHISSDRFIYIERCLVNKTSVSYFSSENEKREWLLKLKSHFFPSNYHDVFSHIVHVQSYA